MGTDERLITLLITAMAYINAKQQTPNPFVKVFGAVPSSEIEFQNLIKAVENCEEFYPEVLELLNKITTSDASQKS